MENVLCWTAYGTPMPWIGVCVSEQTSDHQPIKVRVLRGNLKLNNYVYPFPQQENVKLCFNQKHFNNSS